MAYNSSDPAERLSAVRDAIAECMTAQEFETPTGAKVRLAQLQHLINLEAKLEGQVDFASGGATLGEYDRC